MDMYVDNRTRSLGGDWNLGYFKVLGTPKSGSVYELDNIISWVKATVPGNVRNDLMKAGIIKDVYHDRNNEESRWVENCVWWYEKVFDVEVERGRRYFLDFRGIDYSSQVYLNSRRVGRNEGMFSHQLYEVTRFIDTLNRLQVRVLGSAFLPKADFSDWERIRMRLNPFGQVEAGSGGAATLKYPMSFGTELSPDMRTMGIWDEVNLLTAGEAFIEKVTVRAEVQEGGSFAEIRSRIYLNCARADSYRIDMQLKGADFEFESDIYSFNVQVTGGRKIIERSIPLELPLLWQPWDRGKQHLYLLTVRAGKEGSLQDSVAQRFGIREVSASRGSATRHQSPTTMLVVNGQREFIRGAVWVPLDSLVGRPTEADYREALTLAKNANINTLCVWGGGLREKRPFYELCDEMGMMVLQEFPIIGDSPEALAADQEYLKFVEKEVTDIVQSVINYSSLVAYSLRNIRGKGNKPILKTVMGVLESQDNRRPILFAPDSEEERWSPIAKLLPGKARRSAPSIARDFGLQAVPCVESLLEFIPRPRLWPMNDTWEYHGAKAQELESHAARVLQYDNLEGLIRASQQAQALALQGVIERCRREKARCGGVLFWQLNEPWPSISRGVIDFFRRPKLAYKKLIELYNPLLVSLKYDLRSYKPGDHVVVEAWLINDLAEDVTDSSLELFLEDQGRRLFNFTLHVDKVEADSATLLVKLEIILPDCPSWLLKAILTKDSHTLSTNSYDLKAPNFEPVSLKQ